MPISVDVPWFKSVEGLEMDTAQKQRGSGCAEHCQTMFLPSSENRLCWKGLLMVIWSDSSTVNRDAHISGSEPAA